LKKVIGRTALDLVPQLESHWIERYGDVAGTGRPTRFESGSEAMGRWFDVHALRIGDAARGRVAILFNDITERRLGEERLRHLNDTLEQRVLERTADLENAHEQLRQSQKLEAMGQLTGGVAHDFNNLLTPIIGSLDMLVRRELGSERERRLIDGALQSAERAKTLVQRLLAFARRQPLQPTAVDLNTLVRGMAELIASTSGPRIDVRAELSEDLPPAVADANQLEMAVLNLAVNARDAMPEGGVLTITTAQATVHHGHRSKLNPGPYLRLAVADTGTGMDEETLLRAVEPFFSTKGIGKGTGLGLSMVHGLASQLNGSMTISSSPGKGTIVELWLPVSLSSADTGIERPVELPQRGGLGTALLVDDEELVRMSTADMLMDLGYSVIEAASGEEAVKLIDTGQHFDLLVTDHLMPGMTGTDLAHAVRVKHPNIPVLLVSGYAEHDGIEPGLPRLIKPFRSDQLAGSLVELMTP
jgi:signal transduction histidine kinase